MYVGNLFASRIDIANNHIHSYLKLHRCKPGRIDTSRVSIIVFPRLFLRFLHCILTLDFFPHVLDMRKQELSWSFDARFPIYEICVCVMRACGRRDCRVRVCCERHMRPVVVRTHVHILRVWIVTVDQHSHAIPGLRGESSLLE